MTSWWFPIWLLFFRYGLKPLDDLFFRSQVSHSQCNLRKPSAFASQASQKHLHEPSPGTAWPWKLQRTPKRKAPPTVPAMSWWTSTLHLNTQELLRAKSHQNIKSHDRMTGQLHRSVLNLLGIHRFGDYGRLPTKLGGSEDVCHHGGWNKFGYYL